MIQSGRLLGVLLEDLTHVVSLAGVGALQRGVKDGVTMAKQCGASIS